MGKNNCGKQDESSFHDHMNKIQMEVVHDSVPQTFQERWSFPAHYYNTPRR